MRIPKKYGESKKQDCPFCNKPPTTQNAQGVPTCQAHRTQTMQDRKCMCGSWLELKQGKWGPYFNCIKCGNLSFAKGMSRAVSVPSENSAPVKHTPTHQVVRSDDPRFFQ